MKTEEALSQLGVDWEVTSCNIGTSYLEKADLFIIPYGMDLTLLSLQNVPIIIIQDVVNTQEIKDKLKIVFENFKANSDKTILRQSSEIIKSNTKRMKKI
jgi:galactitol-specific phosphotransferase system IIB component